MPFLDKASRYFGSKVVRSTVAITSILLVLLIGFQNCGKAGFDSAQDAASQSVNPAASAPFAYEATADMITYNSCNSPTSQGKTYNFMIGSYDSTTTAATTVGGTPTIVPKSGVRIHPSFINYALEVLKPDYPNTEVVPAQVQKLLAESELNTKVTPQLSIRSINKSLRLNNVYSKTNTPSLGIDVLPVLGDLANPMWADLLLLKSLPKKSKVDYVDFFPKAENAQNRIEGAFHFNTNEQTAEDYRNAFNKIGNLDAQIVLGFSYEGEGLLISPDKTNGEVMSTAYGRGYQLNFNIPGSWAYHPNNVVTKVTEYDLETNQQVTDSVWDCGVRLKIVRAEDAQFEWQSLVTAIDSAVTGDSSIAAESKAARKEEIITANAIYYGRGAGEAKAGFCPKMDYATLMTVPIQTSVYGTGAYAGKTYAEILEIVRRHLPSSDWDINLAVGCVVPKKFSCYQENERKPTEDGTYYGKFKVANNVNKGCYHQFDGSYTAKVNRTYSPDPATITPYLPTEWCNEFVTVCTKR